MRRKLMVGVVLSLVTVGAAVREQSSARGTVLSEREMSRIIGAFNSDECKVVGKVCDFGMPDTFEWKKPDGTTNTNGDCTANDGCVWYKKNSDESKFYSCAKGAIDRSTCSGPTKAPCSIDDGDQITCGDKTTCDSMDEPTCDQGKCKAGTLQNCRSIGIAQCDVFKTCE